MKTLTLSIKQIYFNQILDGIKTIESRDVKPSGDSKYVYYTDLKSKREFKTWREIPADVGDIEINPVSYDAIKLYTGAYKGKRPSLTVEVLGAEVFFLVNEKNEQLYIEEDGIEFPAIMIDYRLGAILNSQTGS